MLDLAERTIVAMAAAGIGAAGPDAAALATSLTPVAEAFLKAVIDATRDIWRRHAAETLSDAAHAAGATTVKECAAFITDTLSDDRSQELLMRALSIAQDCSLRAKRRAADRSVAAVAADKGELSFRETVRRMAFLLCGNWYTAEDLA